MKLLDKENKKAAIVTAGLILTYQCNLDCTYCYEKNKKDLYMSFQNAKEILQVLLRESGEPLQVMLMGGEPLLAFSLIKEIVEWVDANKEQWKRLYYFFGSTNGTLLDENMKKWFTERKEYVTLALSFDGIPMAQNINRCFSAENIDLTFFEKNWPEQSIQMTISESTVDKMSEGVIFLLERGFRVNPSVAYEAHEWSDSSIEEYLKQLLILMEYYLTHLEKPLIYQLKHPLIDYANELDHPTVQQQQCGAGCGFKMFDVDKKSYPCHMVSPLVLSKSQLEEVEDLRFPALSFEDERCKGCPYISACSTCAGCNYLYRGDFSKRDLTHCKIQQIEVAVCLRYWVFRMNSDSSYASKEMVLAIRKLCNYLYKIEKV